MILLTKYSKEFTFFFYISCTFFYILIFFYIFIYMQTMDVVMDAMNLQNQTSFSSLFSFFFFSPANNLWPSEAFRIVFQ